MTAKQKLRVLVRAAIEICDRDCPNARWKETPENVKEVELVAGKSLYLGHLRRVVAEVALEYGVPINEIEWAVSVNADQLQALCRERKRAEGKWPVLKSYHTTLTDALDKALDRFYATPNVYSFIPSGKMEHYPRGKFLTTLSVTI